jgi:hypothetical protein
MVVVWRKSRVILVSHTWKCAHTEIFAVWAARIANSKCSSITSVRRSFPAITVLIVIPLIMWLLGSKPNSRSLTYLLDKCRTCTGSAVPILPTWRCIYILNLVLNLVPLLVHSCIRIPASRYTLTHLGVRGVTHSGTLLECTPCSMVYTAVYTAAVHDYSCTCTKFKFSTDVYTAVPRGLLTRAIGYCVIVKEQIIYQ